MSKRQKSLFAADFSAVAKSQKLLFASISFGQKSTNFLSKFVSKSKICCRNSRISTFDCRYLHRGPYIRWNLLRIFLPAGHSLRGNDRNTSRLPAREHPFCPLKSRILPMRPRPCNTDRDNGCHRSGI